MSKIYPVHHTDDDLRKNAEELSTRILAHNHRTDNFENLIRDSVLFNVTYIELQNRASKKVTQLMVILTWVSALIAIASLVVAGLSYEATRSGDEWQRKQLELLKIISERTIPVPAATQNSPPVTPSARPPNKALPK